MLNIREAIVVEGRYDKIALEPVVNTTIFTTDGFGIFKNAEKLSLLRRVAAEKGLIVFTDSDGAGLVIRNRLKSAIPAECLKHAYIPDIPGKERRKKNASKEGTLGVEGMNREILEAALLRAGATQAAGGEPITKADFARFGLAGGNRSAECRLSLQKRLGFPEKMSANALLDALNCLYSREEFFSLIE